MAAFIGGAVLAPALAATGWTQAADAIYGVYHLTCHQWAFRSFFLFGPQPVLDESQLATLQVDPYAFIGSAAVGWKMAFCERDLAIYLAALAAGVWYARHRDSSGMSVRDYVLASLPMALDGFTQLFGWRESTWQLRVLTGALFGAASLLFLYPRFESWRYAPEHTWAAAQPPRG